FCSEDVLDRELQLICKAIGFDKGRKSHLTGKLLPVLNDDNRRNLFTCRNNNICMAYKAPLTGIYRFLTPCSNNVVIECTHSNSSALQLIPKVCSEIQERTTILFSGSYNYGADICHPDSCPLKYRDAHSSQLSGNLENSCQENSKTQSLNWLQLWEERCAATINYCNSCHLPYEEALDLVTDNEQQGETLLISRQSYSDRHQHNSIKPILINRLSPGNRPRIFHPKSHALKADVCAVNHILNERLLVGLYSTNNGRDSQLLWISLESENTKYHIKELSLDGRNLLLLTNNSIFAQDTNSTIIKQYSLNKTVNERNDNVRFNIDYSDYQEINLPQETDNILAASLKNDQLHLAITSIHGKTYLALTDGRNADDVYVMSYNISDKSWNCITEPVDGVTAKNIHDYSMVIDDDNQIQFLARESISIPKSGGCISLPIKIPAASKSFRSIRSLEDEQQLNNDTNSQQTLDNGQSSDNKIFAMLAAVPVGFVLGLFGGYILDCIRNRDHKSPDSSNEEEYKHSDNYHWNNSLKQKDPIDSHYYDKCKQTQDYRKNSNNTYYLVRGEEGQYAEYTVMPDKGGQGYVISKNKKQPSQCSSEQYYLVNNLTKEQENKKYFTLADTKGLLTSNSGTKQIRCTADTNKLPGHSISAAYDEITNDRYNQENTASYYTIDDKENRPVRLQVVDIHDVSQSSKVSSESTKSSAKQHNEVVYDIINAPGDDYSDTEETDHNKAYKNKRSIETTV
ncbi:MAG: hypothetical protein OXD32_04325, partial [Endozoicomonadaceae bacterium]|nr:hypothetical protein [Endozoicomonadaceae bacterium]